jgi:hypothetical protein
MTLVDLFIAIANLCAFMGTMSAARGSGGHIETRLVAAVLGVLLAVGLWFLFMAIEHKVVLPLITRYGLLRFSGLLLLATFLQCLFWGILSFRIGFQIMSLLT